MSETSNAETTTFAWDFRGPRAHAIAEHHAAHVREFLDKHALDGCEVWVETPVPFQAAAFLRVPERHREAVARALRPPRRAS